MRIVIDLQGAQSPGSRNRGIGRYTLSLAQVMIRYKGLHEVFIVLNGLFSDSIEEIRAVFSGILPEENICVWVSDGPVNGADQNNQIRRQRAEMVREAFLAHLRPDIILNTSIFEGLGDDAVTSIGNFTTRIPSAVILYDLIPFIHRDIYLKNPIVERWYLNKLEHLRRADLLLSISASSGKEAIDYLDIPDSNVVNISTSCDEHFKPIIVDDSKWAYLQKTYGLIRPFVMYTGGIDYRKNIDGLIKAYARLPIHIRKSHQLAIVCSIQTVERERLQELAKKEGVSTEELVITGFVPEDDLVALYNTCKLFVFPSWHEGFGLPALEAMACGCAVIGANTSSVPEVIENEDALFDPFDEEDITKKIQQALIDNDFLLKLKRHGQRQSKKFSWTSSAQRAWSALENLIKAREPSFQLNSRLQPRPRLAFISPLPPIQSGISDYSLELLPELAKYYQIDVIVNQSDVSDAWILANYPIRDVTWFRENAYQFDRVLYHFGNSNFHSYMSELLDEYPGVIVLHDFFLSGLGAHMEVNEGKVGRWSKALVHSHGWPALQARYKESDIGKVIYAYPSNLSILQQAMGVIVHSEYSRRLAREWYGDNTSDDWSVIPLLRAPARLERHKAREMLGLGKNDFVVCSFGHLGPTKLNKRLLSSWLASPLANNSNCRLVFVGQNHGGEYGTELVQIIRGSNTGSRIEITGWADTNQYQNWLSSADVGVQLRTLSRGETSAAVLDCMNYGLATIVNGNGSMADLPQNTVWMLPDEFSDTELTTALTTLWQDIELRSSLGKQAHDVIQAKHRPRICAEQYANTIEQFYQRSILHDLLSSLNKNELFSNSDIEGNSRFLTTLSNNFPPTPRKKKILLDVSALVQNSSINDVHCVARSLLMQFLENPPEGWIIEPIYINSTASGYRYARRFTSHALNVSDGWCDDEFVETWAGDIFLGLASLPTIVSEQIDDLRDWHRRGIKIFSVIYDLLPVLQANASSDNIEAQIAFQNWLKFITTFNGAICTSKEVADELNDWLSVFGEKRARPLSLGWLDLCTEADNSIIIQSTSTDADFTIQANNMLSIISKKSYQHLLSAILTDNWQLHWNHDNTHRFWGSDNRFGSQVGKRQGREIVSAGSSGFLLFGPYLALAANQYQIRIKGSVGAGGLSGARMDVAINKGTIILAESILSEPNLNGCMAIVPISLDQSCTDLEVRVWVSDQSDLKVSMIEIAPWQDEPIISQEVLKDAEQKVAQVSVSASSVIKNTSRLASTSSSRNQAKSKRKKRR